MIIFLVATESLMPQSVGQTASSLSHITGLGPSLSQAHNALVEALE